MTQELCAFLCEKVLLQNIIRIILAICGLIYTSANGTRDRILLQFLFSLVYRDQKVNAVNLQKNEAASSASETVTTYGELGRKLP